MCYNTYEKRDTMNKQNKEKRTKFTTNTYMREALDYEIVIINEKDFFITIKKYNKVSDSITLEGITHVDNNYFIVEITPLKENYNIRFYVDKNKNIVDYYIDITLENGIKYKIPYYIDLYLDIVHHPVSNKVKFCDEDELKEALDNKIISKRDYNLAYTIGNKLLKEIENNTNKYMKIDVIKYIDRYFK